MVEEVRSRNDIVDVISSCVKIQKKGSNYFGLCPFHSEKSPSFSVSQSKQMFHCFGCGVSGNVITFVMKYENYTFREALEYLANRAGVTLPSVTEDSAEARAREDKREKLFAANKEAARYFYYQLRAPQGERGMAYLKGRELSDETMKQFGLGYANPTMNDLAKYLKSKGFSDEIITEAGLGVFEEKTGLRDKFWNRVIFPIQDINGKVIGFGGRVMGEGKPKYLNSPETMIFDKSRNLYGMNFARTSRRSYRILCEGYMDVIAMHQAGFPEAVASLGTSFTTGQANLLRRYVKEVILAYDSDGAGVTAAMRAIAILKQAEISARVLNLEPYKDPDEFMKNLGKAEFEQRLADAENSFFFELRILSRDYNLKDPEGKTQFHRQIARKLCEFSEEVERENYIRSTADRYDIGYESLRKLVLTYAASGGDVHEVQRPRSGIQKKATHEDSVRQTQRRFLTMLIEEPVLYPKVKKYISPDDFTEEIYRKASEVLFRDMEEGTVNPAGIITMFTDEEEQTEIASLFNTQIPEITSKQQQEVAFNDTLRKLKENSLHLYAERMENDIAASGRFLEAKKALEALKKTVIKLEE